MLPKGRDSTLSALNRGFLLDYRRTRKRATGGRQRIEQPSLVSDSTLNRDFAALGAFFTWCNEVAELDVEPPRLPRAKEPKGRIRWLSAQELSAFSRECPREWWPLFACLFYTGARLGEILGLRSGDVLLHANRLTVHESERSVKTSHSVRDLPIPAQLKQPLADHLVRVKPGPNDLAFPGDFQSYQKLRRVWDQVCRAAGIHNATPRDARHTFGVHAAHAGVPIVRLKELMGHATAAMTLRYMMHAPEAYMDEDAAAIAAHMSGETDQEEVARLQAAGRKLRKV